MLANVDWDDIKFFVSVANHGSLPRAAKELSVSSGTLSRRLGAFEERLGTRLFDRLPSGHRLTSVGQEALTVALRIGSDVDAFLRTVEGEDDRLEGSLVVTVSGHLASACMVTMVRDFAAEHPAIALEIRDTDFMESIGQRVADVAIRVSRAPDAGLVGRRVAHIAFATYAARSVSDPSELPWIGWVDRTGEAAWKAGPQQERPIHHRVSSARAAVDATRSGLGIARLQCYLAEHDPELVRIDEPQFETALWLLTHERLRKTARVRAFLDFMYLRIGADRDRLEAGASSYRLPSESPAEANRPPGSD